MWRFLVLLFLVLLFLLASDGSMDLRFRSTNQCAEIFSPQDMRFGAISIVRKHGRAIMVDGTWGRCPDRTPSNEIPLGDNPQRNESFE
ncbi:hypothetical protein [Bradyrhizobium sp. STM 3843]|uniref:hypothetical protein n=1 Tax=Bradyrhizobium sp. STM 3843 TaxID=551947 RepID=UPI001111F684|nr:hypothetical protein [Bradyrhizobium sp. STM 3843]